MSGARPYESQAMRRALGCALRPGGLALTRRLLALSGLSPGARVLDAGCGQGASLALLRDEGGFAAVGLDPSTLLLSEAAGRGPVASGRAEALPFADGALDAVLCECVLSLTRDKDAVLGSFHRALSPGGLLLLTDMHRKDGPEPSPLCDSGGPGGPGGPGEKDGTGESGGNGNAGGCLDGAEPLDHVFARLSRAGFKRIHFENRDKDLKELAARLIFSHGSLEAFWEAVAGGPPGPETGRPRRSQNGWPGYYLLIAQKDETP